jgi:hypothetical protein
MMTEKQKSPTWLKEARYEGLCYMRYVGEKPLIAVVNGKSPKKIYLARGFEEIGKEEFQRLVQIVKSNQHARVTNPATLCISIEGL